jgi:hypothetical protein
VPTEPVEADLEYSCPRCGRQARARFYGPCPDCRQELADSLGRQAGGSPDAPGAERFEPALHVVPNHVATKD